MHTNRTTTSTAATRLDITMMPCMTCSITTVWMFVARVEVPTHDPIRWVYQIHFSARTNQRHPYARRAEPICIMANALALLKAVRGPNACAQMSWTLPGHTPSKSAATVSHAPKVVGDIVDLFAPRQST